MPDLNIKANRLLTINNDKTFKIIPDFVNDRTYYSSTNGNPITVSQHQTLLSSDNTSDGSEITISLGEYNNNGTSRKVLSVNTDIGTGSIVQQLDGQTGVLLKRTGMIHIARNVKAEGYTSTSDTHSYAAYIGFAINPKATIPESYDMNTGSAYENYGTFGLNGNGNFIMDITDTGSCSFIPKFNNKMNFGDRTHAWANGYFAGTVAAVAFAGEGANLSLYTDSTRTTRKAFLGYAGTLKLGNQNVDNSYNIYLNGTNTTTTSTSGYFAGTVLQGKGASSSDIRLKNIIEDLSEEESIKILKDYKAVKFYWKNDEEKNIMYGTIAQVLRDSLLKNNIQNPGLVLSYNTKTEKLSYDLNEPESDDMSYSIDYTSLINPLIKGWQAHEREIAELKKEIAELKGGK